MHFPTNIQFLSEKCFDNLPKPITVRDVGFVSTPFIVASKGLRLVGGVLTRVVQFLERGLEIRKIDEVVSKIIKGMGYLFLYIPVTIASSYTFWTAFYLCSPLLVVDAFAVFFRIIVMPQNRIFAQEETVINAPLKTVWEAAQGITKKSEGSITWEEKILEVDEQSYKKSKICKLKGFNRFSQIFADHAEYYFEQCFDAVNPAETRVTLRVSMWIPPQDNPQKRALFPLLRIASFYNRDKIEKIFRDLLGVIKQEIKK